MSRKDKCPLGTKLPEGIFDRRFPLPLRLGIFTKNLLFSFLPPTVILRGVLGFLSEFYAFVLPWLGVWDLRISRLRPAAFGISRHVWGFPVECAGDWEVEQGFLDVVFERRSASGRRS